MYSTVDSFECIFYSSYYIFIYVWFFFKFFDPLLNFSLCPSILLPNLLMTFMHFVLVYKNFGTWITIFLFSTTPVIIQGNFTSSCVMQDKVITSWLQQVLLYFRGVGVCVCVFVKLCRKIFWNPNETIAWLIWKLHSSEMSIFDYFWL